jgi:hypothetical protein
VPDGSGMSYSEALSRARKEIKLSDFGIEEFRARRAVTGALAFEIAGEGGGKRPPYWRSA